MLQATQSVTIYLVFEPNPRQQGLKLYLNGGPFLDRCLVFEPNPRQQGLKPANTDVSVGGFLVSLNPIHDNKD